MGKVFMPEDDFAVYLERRITHTKKKLEKVAQYKNADVHKLTDQQLSTIKLEPETQGKLLEITSVREQYERYGVYRAERINLATQEGYERGKSDALKEMGTNLKIVSDYLCLMSQLYRSGKQVDTSKSFESLYKLLELFYSGGFSGGEAIANLVVGSTDKVHADLPFTFADIKKKLETEDKGFLNELGRNNFSEEKTEVKDVKEVKKNVKDVKVEKKDDKSEEKKDDLKKKEAKDEDEFMPVSKKNSTRKVGFKKKNGPRKQ